MATLWGLLSTGALAATEQSPSIPSAGQGVLQSLLGLGLVLAMIAVIAWVAKRVQHKSSGRRQALKLVSELALGTKERVALIEVADKWVLIGVTPSQVSALCTLPKAEIPAEELSPLPKTFAQRLEALRLRNE